MRYTRGVRFKERQRGRLAEMQIDSVTMQKDIRIAQNKNDQTEPGKKEFNLRLIENIEER